MKTTIILLSIILMCSINLHTQESSTFSKNVIYAEAQTVFYASSLSICYERMILSNLSIKLGIGKGYSIWDNDDEEFDYRETLNSLMLYYLTHDNDKLELGIGLSAFGLFSNVTPTASMGYRYQPNTTGLLLRLGLNWFIPIPLPLIQLSLGLVF